MTSVILMAHDRLRYNHHWRSQEYSRLVRFVLTSLSTVVSTLLMKVGSLQPRNRSTICHWLMGGLAQPMTIPYVVRLLNARRWLYSRYFGHCYIKIAIKFFCRLSYVHSSHLLQSCLGTQLQTFVPVASISSFARTRFTMHWAIGGHIVAIWVLQISQPFFESCFSNWSLDAVAFVLPYVEAPQQPTFFKRTLQQTHAIVSLSLPQQAHCFLPCPCMGHPPTVYLQVLETTVLETKTVVAPLGNSCISLFFFCTTVTFPLSFTLTTAQDVFSW